MNIIEGDFVDIETDHGKVTTQAYLSKAMRPDTISITLGQGHTSYGRYAENRGVNPVNLLNGTSVGDAGNLLNKMLRAINIERENDGPLLWVEPLCVSHHKEAIENENIVISDGRTESDTL